MGQFDKITITLCYIIFTGILRKNVFSFAFVIKMIKTKKKPHKEKKKYWLYGKALTNQRVFFQLIELKWNGIQNQIERENVWQNGLSSPKFESVATWKVES